MVIASELKPGMVIRSEGQVYKVLDVESKAGAAKMGGVVKATLSNLHTLRLLENHFRSQERLEELNWNVRTWSSFTQAKAAQPS